MGESRNVSIIGASHFARSTIVIWFVSGSTASWALHRAFGLLRLEVNHIVTAQMRQTTDFSVDAASTRI